MIKSKKNSLFKEVDPEIIIMKYDLQKIKENEFLLRQYDTFKRLVQDCDGIKLKILIKATKLLIKYSNNEKITETEKGLIRPFYPGALDDDIFG